jgi:hypothetical protein
MKTIEIEGDQRPLSQLLAEEAGEEVILLTRGGQKQYALVPFDEMDEEVLAIRRNPELMAYLTECIRRARTEPGIKLEDLKRDVGLE